ncbi:hypothetical protein C8R44DRAFT_726119 [Mycena epipterygia]|nr:hypothetical protein C8R44DRAFT_726119 [Mycena epipterygia]
MTPLFRSLYLPNPRLSVTNLVKFSLPPMASSIAEYNVPTTHSFFSRDANHADIDLLRSVIVPPPSLIGQLTSAIRQQWLDGSESICLPGSTDLFPLWAVDLWSEFQLSVKPEVEGWGKAIEWLKKASADNPKEVKETFHVLSRLAWTGHIKYFTHAMPGNGNHISSLAKFLSRDWLSSTQIDQMTDLILCDIRDAAPSQDIRLMDTIITAEIVNQYRRSKSEDTNDYDPTLDKFLQCFGRSIEDGTQLLGIFHVHEDHWVASTVDVLEQSIGYGDPMGAGVEASDVCAALQWFAQRHHILFDGKIETLLCTRQRDSWNCGLYAPNALAHKFLPDAHPLISSDFVLGDVGRMEMLQRIILKFHETSLPSVKALPSFLTQNLTEYSKTPPSERYSRSPSPPITPPPHDGLSRAMDPLSQAAQLALESDAESTPPLAPIFKRVPTKPVRPKKTVTKVADKAKKSAKQPSAKVKKELKAAEWKKQEEKALAAMPSDVSDDEEGQESATGRPRSLIMDQLTIEVKSDTHTKVSLCGPRLRQNFHAPAHSKRCIKLTSKQRQFASKASADTSPGARAEMLSKGLPAADLEPADQTVAFFGAAGAKQMREHWAAMLDLAIVKLFAAAGLPPRLADYPEYKEVLRLAVLAGPHYVPAGRTILMDNHIMSEQERVRGLQIAFLQTQTRLAVSFDGGDLISGEYFYTVHANTAEGRSFLLEVSEVDKVVESTSRGEGPVKWEPIIHPISLCLDDGHGQAEQPPI